MPEQLVQRGMGAPTDQLSRRSYGEKVTVKPNQTKQKKQCIAGLPFVPSIKSCFICQFYTVATAVLSDNFTELSLLFYLTSLHSSHFCWIVKSLELH